MNEWQSIRETLKRWSASFIRLLPDLLVAVLVFLLAVLVARYLRRITYMLMLRFTVKASAAGLVSVMLQIAVLMVGLFIALDILELNKAVSSLLAGAGIIGIILGFAFQDITSNFIAGLYIAFKKPFDVGHTVKTNDYIGNVEEIQLRSTTIRTFSGLHLMIPNREIIQKPLINYSFTSERRIEFDIYIDSAADLGIVHSAITGAMAKLGYLYPGKPVEVYFNDFRDNAIKISIWYWIDNHAPPGYMVARHDAISNIMMALKEQSISLVVPVSLQRLNSLS